MCDTLQFGEHGFLAVKCQMSNRIVHQTTCLAENWNKIFQKKVLRNRLKFEFRQKKALKSRKYSIEKFMLVEPEDVYQFISCVVNLTETTVRNQMSNSTAMFSDTSSILDDHTIMHYGQRNPSGGQFLMVNCQFCPNKMPPRAMRGHLLRKHRGRLNAPAPARPKKRKCSELQKQMTTQEHHFVSRPRYDSGVCYDPDAYETNIPRPETPPPPTYHDEPAANENGDMGQHLPIAQYEKKNYNLVHISDEQLNKFMEFRRIGVRNGQLYLKDTDEREF